MRDLMTGRGPLADADLAELYAPPLDAVSLGAARTRGLWVRTNLVTSLDGAVTGPDGVSGSLGTEPDARVFGLLRALCDVVLVGGSTARREAYRPVTVDPRWAPFRTAAGLSEGPPVLAVVTRSGDLGPTLAPSRQVVAVDGSAGLAGVLSDLHAAGHRVVLCEGGPSLWQQLLAEQLVDEWCQTLAPTHVGGDAGSLPRALPTPASWGLAGLLEEDSVLLSRWRQPHG
ncbi:dihydrofolate reductase family protein [Kytococcus sedentarius]|uniref:dihydrofolate reductase family protein n=1 Tax=Kytococcus sedentarius TaxID=1276 RepID=UPI0035BC1E0F